jgi:glycine C-acetyltransferase
MRDALRVELKKVRVQGLYRSLKDVSSAQGREITLDGKKVLNFCSNDYLGLACDVRLVQAAEGAMHRVGFGSGGSRLVCGNFDEHRLLEEDLARMKKTEAALVFSSGYMANAGIISALVGRDDVVFSDRLNHASIVDGIVLSRAELKRYPHNDVGALEELLAKATGARRRLIVTDTVFSMDGDVAPLKEIALLAKKYGAWFMVDEAHAFGVLGPTGCGLIEELGLETDVDIQMGTLSKAAGSFGAYAAGPRELIDHLVNTARSFIFTTGLPPAIAAASRAALTIMREEPGRRERVLRSAQRLRTGLRQFGFDTLQSVTPIIPVAIGEATRAVEFSKQLLERGVFVQAIRPPTVPQGTARLRVTVTAAHTDDDIARCLEVFKGVRNLC